MLLRGGFTFAEAPERDARSARLLWSRAVDPTVITATQVVGSAEAIDPAAIDGCGYGVISTSIMPIAIVQKHRRLRIDLDGRCWPRGPIGIGLRVSGLGGLGSVLPALDQLDALWRRGRFRAAFFLKEQRMPRWCRLLRVHDARASGASHRDIAIALFGPRMVRDSWGEGSDFLKSRVRRLVHDARQMAAGGWRLLPDH
ncbi:hypothetical protein FHS96_002581 [Sphingomonas zeicaulis]